MKGVRRSLTVEGLNLERLIRQAAVGLSGTLKRILWGIFRGEDRRERIKLSGVPKTTYFWGLEKLLKLFCGQ